MIDKDNMQRRDVEVDLSPEIAQGNYSNLAIISHSPTEFIIDFASMLPGMQKPRVSNRIILTPEHAKRLMRSLQDNIAKYESHYGTPDGASAQQSQDPFTIISNSSKVGEA